MVGEAVVKGREEGNSVTTVIGDPDPPFAQLNMLKTGDPGICCRLAFKWLATMLKPGQALKAPAVDFFSLKLSHALDKQKQYLAEADPFEKSDPGTWRLRVSEITRKWLNIWGKKYDLKFEIHTQAYTCTEFFRGGNLARSLILGEFGRTATGGNWAHATAYYGGGPRLFFDANAGQFNLSRLADPLGPKLDAYHQYLKEPGETLDMFVFLVVAP
jgi:hypothetical protein